MRWADSTRIGIMGASHGGYSTLMAMEAYPEIFKVGISNSPTTDFRLYDTIWSERYLGLLGENGGAAYDSSSVLPRVGRIRGKLLLVHSMMDDNVHVQHTMQFLTAITDAGIDVDLRIYPPGGHGAVYSAASQMVMLRLYNEYLNRWLRGSETRTAAR
jgi:dipeptidyl-peptidase-4